MNDTHGMTETSIKRPAISMLSNAGAQATSQDMEVSAAAIRRVQEDAVMQKSASTPSMWDLMFGDTGAMKTAFLVAKMGPGPYLMLDPENGQAISVPSAPDLQAKADALREEHAAGNRYADWMKALRYHSLYRAD